MTDESTKGRPGGVSGDYIVRYGRGGYVGRFESVPGATWQRSARVVVRSAIGVQLGQILTPVAAADQDPAGTIVRSASPQDELLAVRLAHHGDRGIDACRRRLQQAGIAATIVDAELTLDARTLCFYFLEDPPPETDAILNELAQTYRAAAGIESFAELLEAGCGPGCGTDEAAGCAGSGCAVCVVARACSSSR